MSIIHRSITVLTVGVLLLALLTGTTVLAQDADNSDTALNVLEAVLVALTELDAPVLPEDASSEASDILTELRATAAEALEGAADHIADSTTGAAVSSAGVTADPGVAMDAATDAADAAQGAADAADASDGAEAADTAQAAAQDAADAAQGAADAAPAGRP